MIENQPTLPAAEGIPRMSNHDYARFSELLLQRCGLYFSEKRRIELETGIRHAFAASTCASLDEYFRSLSCGGGTIQVDRLINTVTVSETHFFRDAAQFDALYHHILPELIQRRRSVRTLRVWSAGCASGEEPYSIAMLLCELLTDVREWAITILGTDINTQALARARRGSYSEWAFREARAKAWRPRYFEAQDNRYELSPEVRRMVTFEKLNLAEARYPAYETNTMFMDLILCRNVTIYFGEQVISQVVDRFYDTLVDGGWLVVGHCEPSLTTYRRFQARNFLNTVAYQRTDQSTVLLPDRDVLSAPLEDSGTHRTLPAAPRPASVVEEPPTGDEAPGVARQPQQDPFRRAKELLEYGHAEQSRAVLLELVASGTRHAPTYALLGRTCANLGDWSEAERWCHEAIVCDRLLLPAYYTLALVLQHQGRLDAAIAAMKKVVYIDQGCVLGHFGLASLSHTLGRQQQALKSLDNACRLLRAFDDDEVIPESGGITAGRLREAAIRIQQKWTRQGANR